MNPKGSLFLLFILSVLLAPTAQAQHAGFAAAGIVAAGPFVSSPVQPYVSSPVQPFVTSPVQPFFTAPVQPFVRSPAQPFIIPPAQPFVTSPVAPFGPPAFMTPNAVVFGPTDLGPAVLGPFPSFPAPSMMPQTIVVPNGSIVVGPGFTSPQFGFPQ